jgi:hypothetical protein
MNTLRIFLGKILPLSLLMPALIITHFFADCSRAENKSAFINERNKSLHIRSLNIINDLPDNHELHNNLAAGEEIINYDLIVKDIIRIFKWLDSDSLKPIFWNNFIRGQYCESSCQLIIEDPSEDSTYKGGSFAGMSSNKYLSSILIYLNEDNSKVVEASIVLKKRYSKIFEVSRIYPMLTNEKFVPFTGAKLGSCDGPCRGGSRNYYLTANSSKYLSRPAMNYKTTIVTGVTIVSGIGGPVGNYRFSKEVLTRINLKIGR